MARETSKHPNATLNQTRCGIQFEVKVILVPPSADYLGPLHTRAESRDHEIVRTQKKVFKARPKTPPTSCSVKSYMIGPSTKCYFDGILFMRVLTHDKLENINGCKRLDCHSLPGFLLGLLPRGGFWKQSKRWCSMIHSMACRNPCRLYIHLAFTYSIGPSSVVWSGLGPLLPFPPMRVLEV